MHYNYTSPHRGSLPDVPMDTSGLSSILNQTSLPLGKEKNYFFVTKLWTQLLLSIISLNFTEHNSPASTHRKSTVETVNNKCTENYTSASLPKCHWYPTWTILSPRGSRKLLGFTALPLEAGGHALGLRCILFSKCGINSWARWCILGPKWWIVHYCSQVLKCRIFI